MNQELDYAQMLEIPVSTVNVVKKKSIFKRKSKPKEDLKERVVESVNERVGADYTEMDDFDAFDNTLSDGNLVKTENLTDVSKQKKKKEKVKRKSESGGKVVFIEAIAACVIAGGIFLTNVFVHNTAINNLMGSLTTPTPTEAEYTDFTLTPVVSELSDAEITQTADGVLSFTEQTSVYPICKGEIQKITEADGLYTVEIAHTSKFTSVVTGLSTVYAAEGEAVAGNLPFAYSDGKNQVSVSMYNGDTLLNCYKLSGAVPVWNS